MTAETVPRGAGGGAGQEYHLGRIDATIELTRQEMAKLDTRVDKERDAQTAALQRSEERTAARVKELQGAVHETEARLEEKLESLDRRLGERLATFSAAVGEKLEAARAESRRLEDDLRRDREQLRAMIDDLVKAGQRSAEEAACTAREERRREVSGLTDVLQGALASATEQNKLHLDQARRRERVWLAVGAVLLLGLSNAEAVLSVLSGILS